MSLKLRSKYKKYIADPMQKVQILDFYTSGLKRVDAWKALKKTYPRHSRKRKILFLINALNVMTCNFQPSTLGRLFNQLPLSYKQVMVSRFVVFLHKINQCNRVYIVVYSEKNKPNSFIKLALSKEAAMGLRQEKDTLIKLGQLSTEFQIPALIKFDDYGDKAFIETEYIRDEFKLMEKSSDIIPPILENALLSLGNSTTFKFDVIKKSHWFRITISKIRNNKIFSLLESIQDSDSFSFCSAHCDLGSTNILKNTHENSELKKYSIIDWEFYEDSAPKLTDRVGYWLGFRHKKIKSKNYGDELWKEFLDFFGDNEADISIAIISLIFLAYKGVDLAEIMCGIKQ